MKTRRPEVGQAKVVKTDDGWEPAFWDGCNWVIEPGFAKSTRGEAEADLKHSTDQAARIDAASRNYASGYSYACGYHN